MNQPSRVGSPFTALGALLLLVCALPALGDDDPRRRLIASLAALVEREPGHAGAMYVAARTAARLGDDRLALEWIDRLGRAGSGDELDPDDFGALAAKPAFRERADRFARAAPPVGRAVVTETTCRDLLPEGTAWDAKRREVLVSSGRQRTVYAVDATGRCRRIVPPADGGLLAVLGMAVDAGTDTLWVASSAAPFMADAKPGEAGTARLARIDLSRGRVIATWPWRGGLLNDVALAPDGSVYVTESAGGAVLRLAPGAAALEPFAPAGTFEGPNGIAWLEGGDLLVADFHGLSLLGSKVGAAPERLSGPPGLYLGGIDGIARRGDRLVAIQNLAGRGRVWSLAIDRPSKSVSATLLLRGHADFRNPTTGALADGRFLFLADPNLQAGSPDGTPVPLPPGRTGHRLLDLSLE